MAWCKLEGSFRHDPKFDRLADGLGLTQQFGRRHGPTLARGLIASLWSWAAEQAQDGDLGEFEIFEIEEAAGWDGAPGAFVAACASKRIGLLDKTRHGFVIHRFLERAESHKAAKRKQRQRERERLAAEAAENAGQSRDSHDYETETVTASRDGHEKVTGEREEREEKERNMAPEGAVGELPPKREIKRDTFGDHVAGGMWQAAEQRAGLAGLPLNETEKGMLGNAMRAVRAAGSDFDAALGEWFRPEWKHHFGWGVEQFCKRIRQVLNALHDPTVRPRLPGVEVAPEAKPGRPIPKNDAAAEQRAKFEAWKREQAAGGEA